MSVVKEAWDALRSVATVIDKVAELSTELRELRAETRNLSDRLVRIETIIEEARRTVQSRPLPPQDP